MDQSERLQSHPEAVGQSARRDGRPADCPSLSRRVLNAGCPFPGDHTSPCCLLYHNSQRLAIRHARMELTTARATISYRSLLVSLSLTHCLCIPLKRISILSRFLFPLPLLLQFSSPFLNRDLGTLLLGKKLWLKPTQRVKSPHQKYAHKHTFAAASLSALCFCSNVSIDRGSARSLAAMAENGGRRSSTRSGKHAKEGRARDRQTLCSSSDTTRARALCITGDRRRPRLSRRRCPPQLTTTCAYSLLALERLNRPPDKVDETPSRMPSSSTMMARCHKR